MLLFSHRAFQKLYVYRSVGFVCGATKDKYSNLKGVEFFHGALLPSISCTGYDSGYCGPACSSCAGSFVSISEGPNVGGTAGLYSVFLLRRSNRNRPSAATIAATPTPTPTPTPIATLWLEGEGDGEEVIEVVEALELELEIDVADDVEELDVLVAGALKVLTALFCGDSSNTCHTTVFPMTDGLKNMWQ